MKIKIKKVIVEYWEFIKRSKDKYNYNEIVVVIDKIEIIGIMNLFKLEGLFIKGKVVFDLSNGVFDVVKLFLIDIL